MKTREEEMNEQAEAFHQRHPRVSILFVRFAKEIIGRGYKNYSVNAIFERIRWETDVPDRAGRSTFKLSNNHLQVCHLHLEDLNLLVFPTLIW